MGGIFGTISKKSCVADLFYGTDYNSHLGTRRGGMATFCKEKGFVRSIHNLESSYFRTKFEPTLDRFEGATSGIRNTPTETSTPASSCSVSLSAPFRRR